MSKKLGARTLHKVLASLRRRYFFILLLDSPSRGWFRGDCHTWGFLLILHEFLILKILIKISKILKVIKISFSPSRKRSSVSKWSRMSLFLPSMGKLVCSSRLSVKLGGSSSKTSLALVVIGTSCKWAKRFMDFEGGVIGWATRIDRGLGSIGGGWIIWMGGITNVSSTTNWRFPTSRVGLGLSSKIDSSSFFFSLLPSPMVLLNLAGCSFPFLRGVTFTQDLSMISG